jgi:hypothetical protein
MKTRDSRRGWGVVRAPPCARLRAALRATPGGGPYRLLSPMLVCDALDRASPNAEGLGHPQDTHALRKLLSHLAFGRALAGRDEYDKCVKLLILTGARREDAGRFAPESAPPPSATPSPRGSMACRAAIKLWVWQCATRCPPYCVPVAGADFSATYRHAACALPPSVPINPIRVGLARKHPLDV